MLVSRSRFARYYKRGQEVALFHSLTGEIISGDSALLDLFLSFPGSDSDTQHESATTAALEEPRVVELEAKGLLVAHESRDAALVGGLLERFRRDLERPIWQLYLVPTPQCNMACTYCFVDTHSSHQTMTTSIARQAVRYFLRHSEGEPKPRIFFYGGEPLLNKAAVFAAAEEARRIESRSGENRKINLSLITNGYALDHHTAEALESWKVRVSVSIDGPAMIHDSHRKAKNGEGTFRRTLGAIELLRDVGIDPGVSVTMTPIALQHWDDVLEFLCETLEAKCVDFNVLLPGPDQSDEHVPAPFTSGEALIRAHARFRAERIYEDRVMRRVKAFKARRFRFTDCPAVGQQIAVVPDGYVGPCQGMLGVPESFPLHLERDFDSHPFEHPLFDEWRNRTALEFPECLDCPAIAICGGGCPLSAMRDRGSIWKVDERVCEQVKPIHEWLVWQACDGKLTFDD